MSSGIKTLLMYVLLVVPPLGVLLLILDCGRRLEPPRALGGVWTIERSGVRDACPDLPALLHVAQSGPQARADESVSLLIDGDHVTGTGRGATPACDYTIDARLAGDQLDGTVRHPACASCTAAPFHAGRKR
jgi:hypothetical protein